MYDRRQSQRTIQLSKLLFDKSANYYYLGIIIEILVGIISIIFSINTPKDKILLLVMILNVLFLLISYFLKIKSEEFYDIAETIRRQTVFSESLDWNISKLLISNWQSKAGTKLVKKYKESELDPDYYSSIRKIGEGRLAEITLESAFYTRHLYIRHKKILVLFSIILLIAIIIILSISPLIFIPGPMYIIILKVIYMIIPIYLGINIINWCLRLSRLISEMYSLEVELETIYKSDELNLENVLRLVSEYNCLVVSGIPVHKIMFNLFYREISDLWDERKNFK